MMKIRLWNVQCTGAPYDQRDSATYAIVVKDDSKATDNVRVIATSIDRDMLQKVCDEHNDVIARILEDYNGKTFTKISRELENRKREEFLKEYECYFTSSDTWIDKWIKEQELQKQKIETSRNYEPDKHSGCINSASTAETRNKKYERIVINGATYLKEVPDVPYYDVCPDCGCRSVTTGSTGNFCINLACDGPIRKKEKGE